MKLKRITYFFFLLTLLSMNLAINNLSGVNRDITAQTLDAEQVLSITVAEDGSGIHCENVFVKQLPGNINQITFPIAQTYVGTVIDPRANTSFKRINCRIQV